MVEEANGQVSWFGGLPPEAQATVVVGIVAVLVQPVFIAATFFLGKTQGRAQLRHERAAEAVVSTLPILVDLQVEFGMWVLYEKRNDLELSHAKEITRLRGELQTIVYDNSPWFEPETESKLVPLSREVGRRLREHTDALKSRDVVRIRESSKQLSEWNKGPLVEQVNALEDEVRRLIGTKRHWKYTRRGRLRKWIRDNLAWRLRVPGGTLIGASLALLVIWLMTK